MVQYIWNDCVTGVSIFRRTYSTQLEFGGVKCRAEFSLKIWRLHIDFSLKEQASDPTVPRYRLKPLSPLFRCTWITRL